MDTQDNDNNTQPHQKIEQDLMALSEQIKALQMAVDNLSSRVLTEEQIAEIAANQIEDALEEYSTTGQIRQIVADSSASLNRALNDGFKKLTARVDDYSDDLKTKIDEQNTTIKFNADSLLVLQHQQQQHDESIRNFNTMASNNTLALDRQQKTLERIDTYIRGDGDDSPGLVARLATVENDVPKLVDSINALTNTALDTNRVLLSIKQRDDKIQEMALLGLKFAKRAGIGLLGLLATTGAGAAGITFLQSVFGG